MSDAATSLAKRTTFPLVDGVTIDFVPMTKRATD
jgi:hypothetical protein